MKYGIEDINQTLRWLEDMANSPCCGSLRRIQLRIMAWNLRHIASAVSTLRAEQIRGKGKGGR